VQDFSGEFPANLDTLISLPGIGRSTAGAILSIAFDQPAPILDGNVRRVLVRLFAWEDDPRSRTAEKQLWKWAGELTPRDRAHDYAQAIMDLGATVCTPRKPECWICPLRGLCTACLQGNAGQLPTRRNKKAVPVRDQIALVIRAKDALLIGQRPPEGLLGGLWEFPVADVTAGISSERTARALLNDLGLVKSPLFIGRIRHGYSHFKLSLAIYAVCLDGMNIAAESSTRWCLVDEMDSVPLHGAHRKALALYLKR
jgi:A/G-specific adenine glycosylase